MTVSLEVHDGGFDVGHYGDVSDRWVMVEDVHLHDLVCVEAGHVRDLCNLMHGAVRDDDYARFHLVTDHVSRDWVDGALFAMWYLGIRYDGDEGWVDPSMIFRRET